MISYRAFSQSRGWNGAVRPHGSTLVAKARALRHLGLQRQSDRHEGADECDVLSAPSRSRRSVAGVAGRYNHAKRAALEAWQVHLQMMITPNGVKLKQQA